MFLPLDVCINSLGQWKWYNLNDCTIRGVIQKTAGTPYASDFLTWFQLYCLESFFGDRHFDKRRRYASTCIYIRLTHILQKQSMLYPILLLVLYIEQHFPRWNNPHEQYHQIFSIQHSRNRKIVFPVILHSMSCRLSSQ